MRAKTTDYIPDRGGACGEANARVAVKVAGKAMLGGECNHVAFCGVIPLSASTTELLQQLLHARIMWPYCHQTFSIFESCVNLA